MIVFQSYHFQFIIKFKQKTQSFIKIHRSASYAIQQLYHLSLASGKYICLFESDKQLSKDQKCCARVFFNKKW